MTDLPARLIITAIALVATLATWVFYGRDGGKSRLEGFKNSETPKGALPLPIITPEFEQRYYRRVKNERRGIAIGCLCIIVPLIFFIVDVGMYTYALFLVTVVTSRAITNMIDRSHELENKNDAIRYSRGRFVSLTDYLPAWAIISILILTVLSLSATFVMTAPYALNTWHPYIFLPLSIILVALSWYMAARIARQPVFATSEADLRWEDRLIANDVAVIPILGALIPSILVLQLAPESLRRSWILAGIILAIATIAIIATAASYGAQRRLWPDPYAAKSSPAARN